MAEIILEGVTKRFPDGALAVKDVDLEIADGEFVILVGPSGCGKSTTLNMIAGLEDITEGTLRIGDRVVNDLAPKERDVAMVFQSYALYPHMNVGENMGFPLRLAKVDKATIDAKVAEAARILDLLSAQVKQGARALHISVGQPPVLRRHGRLQRLKTKVLEPADTMALMTSMPRRARSRSLPPRPTWRRRPATSSCRSRGRRSPCALS